MRLRSLLALAALALLLPALAGAAALPGPVIDEAITYVTGERAQPPSIRTFRGSLNWALLSDLTGCLNGDRAACDGLGYVLRLQLGEVPAPAAHHSPGMYGDEAGGGYAPLQHEIALVLIRHEANGHHLPGDLGAVARRWYGAALRFTALTATRHRDSVLVIGPGSRSRSPVADGLSLPLQLTLSAPPRRFGIGGGPANRPEYFWREDAGAARMLRLMGIAPARLAAESGVDVADLRAWVERRDPAAGRRLASGLRSMHELRVGGWAGGDLAAYWPSYTVGGGPMGGASSVGGQVYGLLPQPVGPRNDTDAQHFASGDLAQRTWLERGLMVGEFRTSLGPADGSRGPVSTQRQSIPIPAGAPVLSLAIDRHGAREVPWASVGATSPPPVVTVPPGMGAPPIEPAPAACRESVQTILDAFLRMRRGELPGGATEMERIIRGEL